MIEVIPENTNIINKDDVNSAVIDIRSRLTITDIRNKAPYKLNSNQDWIEVIKDIRSVFAFIDTTPEIFIFKDMVFDVSIKKPIMKVITTNESTARSKFEKLFIGKLDGKNITAWDVFKRHTVLFAYKYITFYDPDDEDVFSLFRGFYWDEVDAVNMELIQKFLDFVKKVIANDDDNVYIYIIKWIAKLLQNPGIKLETMIVLTGKQGCGKNTFTNIISALARGYSKSNVTSIEHISGKFNASLLAMILIIGNEWTSASLNKHIDKGRHKGVITEDTVEIERKGHDAFTAQNTANFIVNSNEQDPVNIEQNDRRHMVTEVSDKYMQDEEYFGQFKNLSTEFYRHLFTYFRKFDISGWSERKPPMTKPKRTIMNKQSDVYLHFIRNMYETIETTSKVTDKTTGENDIYNIFVKYAEANRFGVPKAPTFEAEMKKYTTTKQHSVKGTRMTTYIIKDEIKNTFVKEIPDVIEPNSEAELKFERNRSKNVDEIADDVMEFL